MKGPFQWRAKASTDFFLYLETAVIIDLTVAFDLNVAPLPVDFA
jgi:hypothetical protein